MDNNVSIYILSTVRLIDTLLVDFPVEYTEKDNQKHLRK